MDNSRYREDRHSSYRKTQMWTEEGSKDRGVETDSEVFHAGVWSTPPCPTPALVPTNLFLVLPPGRVQGLDERSGVTDEHGIARGPHDHAEHGEPDVRHAYRRLPPIPDAQHVAHGLEQGMRVLAAPRVVLGDRACCRQNRAWAPQSHSPPALPPLSAPSPSALPLSSHSFSVELLEQKGLPLCVGTFVLSRIPSLLVPSNILSPGFLPFSSLSTNPFCHLSGSSPASCYPTVIPAVQSEETQEYQSWGTSHHHAVHGDPAVGREVLEHRDQELQTAIPVTQQQHHPNEVEDSNHRTGQVVGHVEDLRSPRKQCYV